MTRFVTAAYRCRQPADTLATLSALLTWSGAQVADASWLAPLGFQVAVASAPRAPAPCCSIGAGATRTDAMVSAAGGMLERWHARNAVPPASVTASAAEAEGFGYQIAGAGTREAELDWVEGWSIPSGRRALAPRDQVLTGTHGAQGTASRRGLAVGNTRDEAIVHAVFEQAEDEAVRASTASRRARQYFDPRSIPDDWSAEVISRVRLTGGHVEVARIPSPCGIPCFSAALRFADDAAAAHEGTAAHCDPSLAMSRALAEAVLSKVARTAIPALRRGPGEPSGRSARPPARLRAAPSWDDVAAGWACQSDGEAADEAARRVTEAAGSEPVVIDLATSRDFAVIKVLFPLFQARPGPPAPGR